ncbi:hypothetical protein ACFQX8_25865 [Klenkia terrae]
MRGIVYFGGSGVAQACWVMAAYAVVGVLGTLAGSGRATAAEPERVDVRA